MVTLLDAYRLIFREVRRCRLVRKSLWMLVLLQSRTLHVPRCQVRTRYKQGDDQSIW
jgi:hypothetical protein